MATHNWIFDHQENLKNMKTIDKQFDAVKYMRQQRDKLSERLSKMTNAEVVAYFKKRKAELTVRPSA